MKSAIKSKPRTQPPVRRVRPLGRRRASRSSADQTQQESKILRDAQRELGISHRQFAGLYKFSPVGNLILDEKGYVQNMNSAAAEMLGLNRLKARLVQPHFSSLVPKDETRKVLRLLTSLRKSADQMDVELKIERKEAAERIVKLIARYWKKELGLPAYFHIVMVDITGQCQREQRIVEQARLLDLSFDAIFMRDMNDRITFWNRGAEEIYGYTRKEALGKVSYKLLKTRLSEPVETVRKKLLRDDRWTGELTHRCRTGERITLSSRWALVRDANGYPRAILESNNNITLWKRAEHALIEAQDLLEKRVAERSAELRLANQKLQALFDASPLAILTVDLAGNVRSWNETAGRMFGWTEAEVLGKPVPHIPQEKREEFNALHEAAMDGKTILTETERCRKDGTSLPVRVADASLRNAQGKIVGMMGMIEDISERRRLEKALLDVSEEEKARLGRDLHDGLGQHLAGISFMAETLKKKLDANSRVEAELAAKIVGHLQEAINVSRDLAKGLFPVELRTQGFVPGLEQLASAITERFRLQCVVRGRGQIRVSDENMARNLYRLAQEAAFNAAKHSQGKTIRISVAQRDGQIQLTVEDDGVGIPDELEKKPGMGLRIMQYRARMLGGTLDIRRGRRGGTVVTCTAATKG
jgi:two-component system sensor kinase FixL